MNSPNKVSLHPAKSYTPQQWEQKRALITRLYRDEANTLHQVRLALAEGRFRPTEPMLKKRIKKWGLDRKFKEADMTYALRLALDRVKSGKQTEFLIRERTVTFSDIQKYFGRKGIKDLQAFVNGKSSVQPKTTMRSCTPSPKIPVQEDFSEVHTIALPDLPSRPEVHNWPVSRTASVQLEKILKFGRIFYDVISRQGRAAELFPKFRLPDLQIFQKHLKRAHLLLDQHRNAEAFQHFNDCFDLVHHLLRSECPILVPCLYQILVFDWHITSIDVISRLVGFVADMMIAQNHPGASIAKLLPQCVKLIMPLRTRQMYNLEDFEQARDLAQKARASTRLMLQREYPNYPLRFGHCLRLDCKIDWFLKRASPRLSRIISPALVLDGFPRNQKDDREYFDSEEGPMIMDSIASQSTLEELYHPGLLPPPAVSREPTHLSEYQFGGFLQSTHLHTYTTSLPERSTSYQTLSYQIPTYGYQTSTLIEEESGGSRSQKLD